MLSPTDVLVHSLSSSQKLLNRYCEDLTPAEYLHRPCGGANCVAWLIGHLVISERSALGRVGMTDVPPLPEGFEKRFARDAEAPKAEAFGDVSILLPLFNQHRQLLIDTVKGMPVEKLEQPLEKPHPMFGNIWSVVNFMALHVSMHAGQITIIRRSLGRPPLM
jgi:uncharacterized damage-inducible protein DinB